MGSPAATVSSCAQAAHTALKQWRDDRVTTSPFDGLYLYSAAMRKPRMTPHRATNQVLETALARLEANEPADARLLRMRFIDDKLAYEAANARGVSEAQLFILQRAALARLGDALEALEAEAAAQPAALLRARLEQQYYARLIGADAPLAELTHALNEGPAHMIAITGLGGLGKTTLADALARQCVGRSFDDVGWVTAQRQRFHPGGAIMEVKQPALTVDALIERLAKQLVAEPSGAAPTPATKTRLAAMLSVSEAAAALEAQLQAGDRRYLLVVDNLETVTDLETLLPVLRRLAGPSARVLLTSREGLYGEPGVSSYVLRELGEADALELVRAEAHAHNVRPLLAATDAELRPVYECVGGNPLALRLIVGQAHVHALATVLADLATAPGARADSLYTYIYRQAWVALDENSRQVWMAATLSPRATVAELANHTGLPGSEVCRCVEVLTSRSLVDCRGDLREPQYTVHALTRTFLHAVVEWS
jgi:hypothetical protein